MCHASLRHEIWGDGNHNEWAVLIRTCIKAGDTERRCRMASFKCNATNKSEVTPLVVANIEKATSTVTTSRLQQIGMNCFPIQYVRVKFATRKEFQQHFGGSTRMHVPKPAAASLHPILHATQPPLSLKCRSRKRSARCSPACCSSHPRSSHPLASLVVSSSACECRPPWPDASWRRWS